MSHGPVIAFIRAQVLRIFHTFLRVSSSTGLFGVMEEKAVKLQWHSRNWHLFNIVLYTGNLQNLDIISISTNF